VSSTPAWLVELRRRADQAPAEPRLPLCLGRVEAVVGSIEAPLAERMREAGLPLRAVSGGWQVEGTPDASLALLAQWLHEHGLAGRWRNELLAVTLESGTPVAAIERAAVRPLGIATQAVHLVGRTADGKVWVQQRALDKGTDPGLWDTLMGGLMSAGESVALTLERETWEEAGLRIADLSAVAAYGGFTVRRPVDGGYMVEHTHLIEATLPAGRVPTNQDGEVQRFECLDLAALLQRLQGGEFTLEAALALAHWPPVHTHLGGPG